MPARGIVQRGVRSGRQAGLRRGPERMRVQALGGPGYISGETLRRPTDPSLSVVISTWEGLADGQRWARGPDRAEFGRRIGHLAAAPTQGLILESMAMDRAAPPAGGGTGEGREGSKAA